MAPATRFKTFLAKYFPAAPTSRPSAQSLETFKFDNIDFHTQKGKKLLYTIYRRYPAIFRGVQLRASIAIPSVKFKTENPKAIRVLAKFLTALHPTSGQEALAVLLRDLWIDTDVFGTSFIDPIWDKKKMNYLGLKRIHPISMDLIREQGEKSNVQLDAKGNPIGWVQEINSQKKELTFKEVQFLTFNSMGDEILGLSTLEPIYKTTWRLMNIEEGIATAIFRHGFPLYDITVAGGIEGRPPTKEQLDDAAKQVKGLNYKSEFIHPPNYKVKLHESFSMGKGEDYTGTFLDSISSNFGIPKHILLGSAAKIVSAPVSESLIKMIEPALRPNLIKLKLFFEEQILMPLMKANHITDVPEIEFGRFHLFEDPEEKTKIKKPIEENPKDIEDEDDEETPKIKKPKKIKTELSESKLKKLPGLYIVQPHANLIYEGEKKQIIKSPKAKKMLEKYVGKDMYLVSENKVLGIINLRKPREIDVNEFIQLRYAHLVTDEERKEWWPKERKLFVYEFETDLFPKLKKFDVPKGAQVIIREVLPE